MKTLLVIDRIEEDWAVMEYPETKAVFNMPFCLLPAGAAEGDIISMELSISREITAAEKERIGKLLEGHMEDD